MPWKHQLAGSIPVYSTHKRIVIYISVVMTIIKYIDPNRMNEMWRNWERTCFGSTGLQVRVLSSRQKIKMVLAHNGWCASLSMRCEVSNREGSTPFRTAQKLENFKLKWSVSRAGHNVALSRRRSRVRVPYRPQSNQEEGLHCKDMTLVQVLYSFDFFILGKRPGLPGQSVKLNHKSSSLFFPTTLRCANAGELGQSVKLLLIAEWVRFPSPQHNEI